jgi:hypothetical protein
LRLIVERLQRNLHALAHILRRIQQAEDDLRQHLGGLRPDLHVLFLGGRDELRIADGGLEGAAQRRHPVGRHAGRGR